MPIGLEPAGARRGRYTGLAGAQGAIVVSPFATQLGASDMQHATPHTPSRKGGSFDMDVAAIRAKARQDIESGAVTDSYRADRAAERAALAGRRSEEHTSELQSLMRISYAVFCLTKKNNYTPQKNINQKNKKT